MIVVPEFAGDDNKILMRIQHDMYGESVARLFVAPRDRYLAASRLLRVEDDLSTRLRSMRGFDHRTLQDAHDRIAAFFRFSTPDAAQFRLGEEESDFLSRLEESWRDFFAKEVDALTWDDEFTRAICTATAFGNEEAGVAAERWLYQFLKERYRARGLGNEPK